MNIKAFATATAVAVAFLCAAPDRAFALPRERELSISLGYAQLSTDNEALSDLDNGGGFRFEPRFSWVPFDHVENFRLGIGLGLSFFYDEEDSGQTFGGFADVEDFEEISLLVPELQMTWRQTVRANWFVEGGVGVGPVFGNFRAGQVVFEDLVDEDVSEWAVGLSVRPLVRIAYAHERWNAGLEASYLFTDLDFDDDLDGKFEELYIGLFYSFVF